jgi:Flp pilus assembly protein TadG
MRRRADQAGQAAVELALALPLIALLLLAVVQVGLVVRDQVLTVHASREAARVAAVDPDPAAPAAAALRGSGLRPDRLAVRVERGTSASAAVTYRAPTDVPIIGALLPDLSLRANTTMRTEQ